MNLPPLTLNLLCDGHVHTRFCHHARGDMEDYVQAAQARGLEEIIFLEHMETGIDYFESTWLTEDDFDLYFAEGKRLQKKYNGTIRIGLGVEVGYNPDSSDEIISRLHKRSWDRIGISCHFYRPGRAEQHVNLLSRKIANIDAIQTLGCEQVLTHYFNDLLEATRILPGTVLCHIDAALRYQPHLTLQQSHYDQIERILDVVEEKNMAVELNTSGFAIRQEPFPAEPILRRVIDRNIPLVAGSDAHTPEDVGRFFEKLR